MTYYSKLIAAVIGLLVIIGSRYGLDLVEHQQTIVDAVAGLVTALTVWRVKNKPSTDLQVDQARAIANEGAKEVRDAS